MTTIESIKLGGIPTTALIWGPEDGVPVVVAHSAGLDAASLTSFGTAAAQRGHRVHAIDLRGHGHSAARPAQVTLRGMAADVLEAVELFALDRPRLLGISMGGVVAGMAAAADPSRWRDLAVLCSPDRGYPAFESRAVAWREGMAMIARETIERWFTETDLAERPSHVVEAEATVRAMHPLRWDAVWRDFAQFEGWSRPEGLPVRSFAGARDVSTPPAVVQRIADVLGAELTVLPDAPHQLLYTHVDEVLDAWGAA
ncbi:alpha/beta fold hydrolase [Aeromicrobium phragmitis]|uniref:Alpha/beta fold hydrolase n=1 Tax=Aeromicrobium phragmitis TaxID=2478914 RepID=A0A3L8PQK8_9ACTN|nr:alpha/beta hydrolase [Aeromicrobium phragmitis]RLV57129.1 alpha/beta fold hydrolase [Aeromicrobium phragmitis]